MDVAILACETVDHPGWLALRREMFPGDSAAEHRDEMASFCAQPQRYAQFLARVDDVAAGFIEVALRSDYVNGTSSSPVAFLEAIYVVPQARRRGLARALVTRARAWARARGCTEFASDARLENTASHAMHRALGFVETERVVYFRQSLDE